MPDQSLIEKEIPPFVLDLLSELKCIFDMSGYSIQEQVRYVSLFLYKEVRDNAHAVSEQKLTKILGAIHAGHQNGMQRGVK